MYHYYFHEFFQVITSVGKSIFIKQCDKQCDRHNFFQIIKSVTNLIFNKEGDKYFLILPEKISCLAINWESCLCILRANTTLAASLNLPNLPRNSVFLYLSFQVITSVVNSISIKEGDEQYYLHHLFQIMNSVGNSSFNKQSEEQFMIFGEHIFYLVMNWQYCLCILSGTPTVVAILDLINLPKVSLFFSL